MSAELREKLDGESLETYGVPAAQLTVSTMASALAEDYTLVGGTRYAVACGGQPTRSAAWYKRLSDRQGPAYPLFAWAYGLSAPCGYWSDAPKRRANAAVGGRRQGARRTG